MYSMSHQTFLNLDKIDQILKDQLDILCMYKISHTWLVILIQHGNLCYHMHQF